MAVLLAIALAGVVVKQMAVVGGSAFCETLTPDDTFLWWFFGCKDSGAGGGGSGAG